ncbi:putative phage holin [Nocardia abscessus]|uniref:putative phage holin n=1 Tax=Nocardia abscessus TaxID=120957 RepID=UPI002458B3A5|nr:hypothetical protein [Nocardia abscessus]
MTAHVRRYVLAVAALLDVLILVIEPPAEAAIALLIAIAAKSAVLTAVYGLGSPWYRTKLGSNLLALAGSVAVGSAVGALRLLEIRYPYDERIVAVLVAIVAFSFIRFLLTVVQLQQEGRRRDAVEPPNR